MSCTAEICCSTIERSRTSGAPTRYALPHEAGDRRGSEFKARKYASGTRQSIVADSTETDPVHVWGDEGPING